MSSVVIAGDTSGSVTLQAPAIAGSTVLTLPATSGTIAIGGTTPSFSTLTVTGNTNLATSGGFVGIGTSSPIVLFQAHTATNANLTIQPGYLVSGSSMLQTQNDTGGALTPMEFRASQFTFDGSVGVGTGATSPSGALTVAGVNCDTYLSGSNAVRLFLNGPSTTWAISSNYYYTGGIAFTNNGTGVFTLPQAGGFCMYTNTTVPLGSQTGASNVSTINQSGLTLTQYGVTAGFYYDRLNFTNSQYYVVNASSVGVYLGNGSTSWSSISDERLKDITGTYTNALGDISKIKPIKFTWKADEGKKPQVGVIAQSVIEAVPEAVESATLGNADDDTEYLSVRYTELVPLLIASVQELNAKVTALEAQLGAK